MSIEFLLEQGYFRSWIQYYVDKLITNSKWYKA